MNPEWLCYVNGQEFGPYTWPQLVQMAASGNVVPQTYVRRNFDSQWYLAEQVPNLFATAPAAVAPKPAAHPAQPPRATTVSGALKKSGASKSGSHPVPSMAATADTQPISAAADTMPRPLPAQSLAPTGEMRAAKAPTREVPAFAPATIPPGVPKGKVVVRSQPQPAAAPNTPQWIPTGNSSPSVKTPATSADDAALTPKKKDNTKTMVFALGGVIAAVAILGGIALIWKFTRPSAEPEVVATAPVEISPTETNPETTEEQNPAAEVNPAVEIPKPATNPAPSNPKTATTPAKPEPAGTKPPAANAATATLVKSVTAWKPVERFGTVGTRNGLSCTKLTVYLAADAAGRKVGVRPATAEGAGAVDNTSANVAPDPAGTAAEGTPPIAAPIVAAPAATTPGNGKYVSTEAAPYLFVEMTIKNSDTKPLVYPGWNSAEAAAVLVDPTGQPFKLLPPAATPKVPRQVGKEVPPGATLQDTLVFEVPPTADLSFRLVLPRPAFSAKLSGAWGYEITGSSLATATKIAGGDPANPAAPATPRSSVSVPIPGLQEPLPAEPAPQPAGEKPAAMPEPEKKPEPRGPIPIPGLTDGPDNKPAGPKKPEEVPNLAPPPKK